MTQPHLQPAPAAASSAGASITLVNLNMLFVRYYDKVERELHVPLGTLYLTASTSKPASPWTSVTPTLPRRGPFARRPPAAPRRSAPIIGLSCMANLLPFTILTAKTLKGPTPDRTALGGGAFGVEEPILARFPWIDVIAWRGEPGGPALVKALRTEVTCGTCRASSSVTAMRSCALHPRLGSRTSTPSTPRLPPHRPRRCGL